MHDPMKGLDAKILIIVMPTIACLFSVVTCLSRCRCEIFKVRSSRDQSESGNTQSIAMVTRTIDGDAHEVTQSSRSSQTIGIQVDILSVCDVKFRAPQIFRQLLILQDKELPDENIWLDHQQGLTQNLIVYCSVHDVEEKRSSLNSTDSSSSSVYSTDSKCAACAFDRLKHHNVISNPYEEDGDNEVQYKDVATLDSHLIESPTDELYSTLNEDQDPESSVQRQCFHESLRHVDPELSAFIDRSIIVPIQGHPSLIGNDQTPKPCHTVEASHDHDDLDREHSEYMILNPESATGCSCQPLVETVIANATCTENTTASSGYDILKRPAIEQFGGKLWQH